MEPNAVVRVKSGTTPRKFAGKIFRAFKETFPSGKTRYNVDVSSVTDARTALGWSVSDWRQYDADEIEDISGEEF